jgi:hypothetical protein
MGNEQQPTLGVLLVDELGTDGSQLDVRIPGTGEDLAPVVPDSLRREAFGCPCARWRPQLRTQ